MQRPSQHGVFTVLAGLCVCLLPLGQGACRPAPARPSILLIVVDSLRADHLHHAGDPRRLSPDLDDLAAESTRFSQAFAAAPWTTPSVMSLFTGLTPSHHHVDNSDRSLAASVTLLAERLKRAGYATGAVMPALTLADHFGFKRGFDQFVMEQQGHGRVSSPWTMAHALSFIHDHAAEPFFLYLHFWDVHYNYNPPMPYAVRFQSGRPPGSPADDDITRHVLEGPDQKPLPADRVEWLEGQYAGEINYTDDQIGRLLRNLDGLGLDENTIVVVTADHGEGFQEHGILGHTIQLYDEMVHVPLLVRWPGRVAPGRVVEQPVGLVDLAPTLLDLAGFRLSGGQFDGESRAAELVGEAASPATPGRPILLGTSRRAGLRGLRGAHRLFLRDLVSGKEELYDLDLDPGQQTNLAGARPGEAKAWRLRLCSRLAQPPAQGEIPIVPMAPAIKAALDAGLRTLGYVGGGPSSRHRGVDPAAERRNRLESLDCPAVIPGSVRDDAAPAGNDDGRSPAGR
ncbi:MAG: sulfatase [Acidobacteriota bacterium]